MTKKEEENVINFLQERLDMRNAGFPYCYPEGNIPMHCDTCRNLYKKLKKVHNK